MKSHGELMMIGFIITQLQSSLREQLIYGSVQEDDGPLRCNPSFQKQHHATKKYINPSLT